MPRPGMKPGGYDPRKMAKQGKSYQVQSGQTPATIAAANNTTPERLLQENKYGAPFQIGQTIKLPPPTVAPGRVKDENVGTAPGPLQQTLTNIGAALTGIPRSVGFMVNALTPQPNPFTQGNPAARVATEYQRPGAMAGPTQSVFDTRVTSERVAPSSPQGYTSFAQNKMEIADQVLIGVRDGMAPAKVNSNTAAYVNQVVGTTVYDAQGNLNPSVVTTKANGGDMLAGGKGRTIEGTPTKEGVQQNAWIAPNIHGHAWQTKIVQNSDGSWSRITIPTYGQHGRGGQGAAAHGKSGNPGNVWGSSGTEVDTTFPLGGLVDFGVTWRVPSA